MSYERQSFTRHLRPPSAGGIRIVIERAEGPTEQCDGLHHFDSLCDANRWLFSQSTTAPEKGGYDKCDFAINFGPHGDGDMLYEGRYDLVHYARESPSLNRHIRQFNEYLAKNKHGRFDSDDVAGALEVLVRLDEVESRELEQSAQRVSSVRSSLENLEVTQW